MIGYQIHNISEGELKFGYWFLTHKGQLKKALIILLIVWCFATFGYGIFGFAYHFLAQKKLNLALQQIAGQQINFSSYQQKNRPKDLVFFEPTVIYTGNNRYDIMAVVKNLNERWLVRELVYQLESGEFVTATATAYLLPVAERRLIKLAIESPKRISALQFKVIDLKWERYRASQELPPVDFTAAEVKFNSSDNQAKSWVGFSAVNNTISNFWEVNWQAVLYSGQKIVGLNQTTIEEFLSGEKREVMMSWYERLPRITRVEVFPDVDVLNPEIIYRVPGQAESLY